MLKRLSLLLLLLLSLTTYAQTQPQANSNATTKPNPLQHDFDAANILKGLQNYYTSDAYTTNSKALFSKTGISFYPAFHFNNDTALMPFVIELYFKKRIQKQEPYIIYTLNLTPTGQQWYDFTQQRISVSLSQGTLKLLTDAQLKTVEDKINAQLAQSNNFTDFLNTLGSKVKGTIDDITALFAKNNRPYPIVRFYASTGNRYGFDAPQYKQLLSEYEQFTRPDSTVYTPWKALGAQPETIKAQVTLTDSSQSLKNIVFVNQSSSPIPATANGKNSFELSLMGATGTGDVTALYRYTDDNNKEREKEIGQLKTIAFLPLENKLVLIPINGASVATAAEIKTQLNAIYGQAAAAWEVSLAANFSIPTGTLANSSQISIETGTFKRYSGETQAIINAYKAQTQADDNTRYLFVASLANDKSYNGYMPIGGQYGFIFTTNGGNALTMAHELGHGAFNLQHPQAEWSLPTGTTNNLMDYAGGTALWKAQWEWVHEPPFSTGVLQDEEDGAMKRPTAEAKVLEVIEKIRCGWTTNRPIMFNKSGFGDEEATVYDYSFTGDVGKDGKSNKYKFVKISLEKDISSLTIRKIVQKINNGEEVFDFGDLKIYVNLLEADAFGKFLFPVTTNNKPDKISYVEDLNLKLTELLKTSTNSEITSVLSNVSQCFYETLSVEFRLLLLKKLNIGADLPNGVELIAIDIIRTMPSDQKKAQEFLKGMQDAKLFEFFDGAIDDFGGDANYTRYLKELANLYELAFPNELENLFGTDQFNNVYVNTTTSPTTIGYYQIGYSKYATPLIKWQEGCNTLGISYNNGIIDVKLNGNCGYPEYAPKQISPLTPIVIEFSEGSDYAIGSEINNRVVALPAFIAMRYANDSRSTAALNLISDQVNIVGGILFAGEFLASKAIIGKGFSALAKKTYFWFKTADNSLDFLFSFKEFKDIVNSIGTKDENGKTDGKKFAKSYNDFQNNMELIGFSTFDAIAYSQKTKEIISNLHDLERYWQIVRLHPYVKEKLDEDQKEEITKAIKNALSNYEKTNIVE